MSIPILYDYFRSSAAYRVRIALGLKGVAYERVAINLLDGAHKTPEFRALTPQAMVPALEIDGLRLTQSLAIVAYLDATRPDPPLLPADPAEAAQVRALALAVACDIHPINNLRILRYLKDELGQEQAARDAWYRHWVAEGFDALEAMAEPRSGCFLFGDSPTLADICLVPQMFNARRFEVPLDRYPTLVRADAEANRLAAFAAAHPDAIAASA